MLISNIASFMLTETPKFLAFKDLEKTKDAFNYINKINNPAKLPLGDEDLVEVVNIRGDRKSYTFIDLFRYKSVRTNLIGMAIFYCALNMIYYGSSFAIAFIGLDIYTNGMMLGIADGIGFAIGIMVCTKIKRSKGCLILALCSSCSVLPLIFFNIPDSCEGHMCY